MSRSIGGITCFWIARALAACAPHCCAMELPTSRSSWFPELANSRTRNGSSKRRSPDRPSRRQPRRSRLNKPRVHHLRLLAATGRHPVGARDFGRSAGAIKLTTLTIRRGVSHRVSLARQFGSSTVPILPPNGPACQPSRRTLSKSMAARLPSTPRRRRRLEYTILTRLHLDIPSMQSEQRGAMPDGDDGHVRQNCAQHAVDFRFQLFVKRRCRLIEEQQSGTGLEGGSRYQSRRACCRKVKDVPKVNVNK